MSGRGCGSGKQTLLRTWVRGSANSDSIGSRSNDCFDNSSNSSNKRPATAIDEECEWPCAVCTLVNRATFLCCDACGALRAPAPTTTTATTTATTAAAAAAAATSAAATAVAATTPMPVAAEANEKDADSKAQGRPLSPVRLRCPKDEPRRAHVTLPGLYVFDEFITEEEEMQLLAYLDQSAACRRQAEAATDAGNSNSNGAVGDTASAVCGADDNFRGSVSNCNRISHSHNGSIDSDIDCCRSSHSRVSNGSLCGDDSIQTARLHAADISEAGDAANGDTAVANAAAHTVVTTAITATTATATTTPNLTPGSSDSLWKISSWNGAHYVQKWGVRVDLRLRTVAPAQEPLPAVLDCVLRRMRSGSFAPLRAFVPNEANAISYHKAQGHWLRFHFDDRKLSGELLANLTLAGACYMQYEHASSGRHERVLLRRRSLQVVTGEARYTYKHGITNEDLLDPRRVSITFRHTDTTARQA